MVLDRRGRAGVILYSQQAFRLVMESADKGSSHQPSFFRTSIVLLNSPRAGLGFLYTDAVRRV